MTDDAGQLPNPLREHIETYYPLDYDETTPLVVRVMTAAINIRESSSSFYPQDRPEVARVLWQARRFLTDRGEWYGYNTPATWRA